MNNPAYLKLSHREFSEFNDYTKMNNYNANEFVELVDSIETFIMELFYKLKNKIIPEYPIFLEFQHQNTGTVVGFYDAELCKIVFCTTTIAMMHIYRGFPIPYVIVSTIVHELLHVKQPLDRGRYARNICYNDTIEDFNDIETVNFLNENIDYINELCIESELISEAEKFTLFEYQIFDDNNLYGMYNAEIHEKFIKVDYKHTISSNDIILHYAQMIHANAHINFEDMIFPLTVFKNFYIIVDDKYHICIKNNGQFLDSINIAGALGLAKRNKNRMAAYTLRNFDDSIFIIHIYYKDNISLSPIQYVMNPSPIYYEED